MNEPSTHRRTPSVGVVAAIALLAAAIATAPARGQPAPTASAKAPASTEAYRNILTYPEWMKPVGTVIRP